MGVCKNHGKTPKSSPFVHRVLQPKYTIHFWGFPSYFWVDTQCILEWQVKRSKNLRRYSTDASCVFSRYGGMRLYKSVVISTPNCIIQNMVELHPATRPILLQQELKHLFLLPSWNHFVKNKKTCFAPATWCNSTTRIQV